LREKQKMSFNFGIPDWVPLVYGKFSRYIDNILKFLIISVLTLLIASALLLFAIAWHQLSLLGTNVYIPEMLRNGSLWTIRLFDTNLPVHNNAEINSRLSIFVGILGAFVTSFFSLGLAISTWYFRRQIKKSATIQTTRIFRIGVDDIQLMMDEYALGARIIVFGGDFSWMSREPTRSKIVEMIHSNRIEFISYKSSEKIKSALGRELFYEVSPKLSCEVALDGLKASLIYDSDGSLATYMYQTKEDEGGKVLVCKIKGKKPDGRRLLSQIHRLVKDYLIQAEDETTQKVILVCGKSKTGKSEFSKALSFLGYKTVSVGELLIKMYKSEHNDLDPTPEALLEYGKDTFRPGTNRAEQLRSQIFENIERSNRPVVIDGLRVPWIFSDLVHAFTKVDFILFESDEEERVNRLRAAYKNRFSDSLLTELNVMDSNINALEMLSVPKYRGPGGEKAISEIGIRDYAQ
jgi:hypothetical protein